MKNRIDLNKFNIRTDLVIDSKIKDSYIDKKKVNDSILVTSIDVNEELGIELGKKMGSYITIEFEDVTNHEDQVEIMEVLSEELKGLLNKKKINDNILVTSIDVNAELGIELNKKVGSYEVIYEINYKNLSKKEKRIWNGVRAV